MKQYYIIDGSLFESNGNDMFKCVASSDISMLGIITIKPKSRIFPVSDKAEGLRQIKEDAYYENRMVFEEN